MIQVKVTKVGKFITELEVSGHAYSGEPGFDLVCAGVSSITTGALNGFYELDNQCELIMTDDPFIKIKCEEVNKDNQLLLNFLLIQLKTVEEVHSEHLQITVKEEFR